MTTFIVFDIIIILHSITWYYLGKIEGKREAMEKITK